MKKLIAFALVAGVLASCSGEKTEKESTEAKGGVYYGGVFRMNELEDFKNLYPLAIVDVVSHRVANQVYEGLVKLNQADLTVTPGVAYKWETNETQTVWTFHLRQGVLFHDDACFTDGKGREVKASDFKYCLDKVCESNANNAFFEITFKDKVKGANEYFEASKSGKMAEGGVPGIKAVDDSTLTIELMNPYSGFLNILSTPAGYVYPKEAFTKYAVDMRTHCVGTGPFMVKTVKEGDVVILEKNKNYYGVDEFGNKLPYLDAIKYTFVKEKKSEMLEFQRGNLDMVFRIPIEMYKEIMGDYQNANARKTDFDIQTTAAISTNYYGLLVPSTAFAKKEVRLAFNYAVDRNKIVDFTLQGQGVAGEYGVIPPVEAFKKLGIDFDGLKGYSYDVAKAKDYMKKAGYPDGKNFPKVVLTINSGGGERNQQIAEVIQKMLKENIGVTVEINVVPFAEQIDAYQSGKLEMFRTAWIADYPDPSSFLGLFYGKNVPATMDEKSFTNTSRFKNDAFDAKFETAMKEPDAAKRAVLFKECDQILIDEGALMPLFYDENDRLVQKNVRNFPINAMEYRDFTRVYIIPKDKLNPPATAKK
ncbi:MAG: transporter substrate-binding protein [Bacteroidetes bacterium]|jgi:peptide/nickel transport system substrate-binding protein|nr:transporter substrate-binding protein [Bacteroidota bacterium]